MNMRQRFYDQIIYWLYLHQWSTLSDGRITDVDDGSSMKMPLILVRLHHRSSALIMMTADVLLLLVPVAVA